MSDDLFAIPARARRTDPETSHEAARAIEPVAETIRRQVEAFAHGKAERGFIDEDLSAAFEGKDVSSYRTRRAELVVERKVVDSGLRRANSRGHPCIIWVHHLFAGERPETPPLKPIPRRPDTESLKGSFEVLEAAIDQMRRDGWMIARSAKDALDMIRKAKGG